jgi:hypothetical protein
MFSFLLTLFYGVIAAYGIHGVIANISIFTTKGRQSKLNLIEEKMAIDMDEIHMDMARKYFLTSKFLICLYVLDVALGIGFGYIFVMAAIAL